MMKGEKIKQVIAMAMPPIITMMIFAIIPMVITLRVKETL